jgi:hypothetical protein
VSIEFTQQRFARIDGDDAIETKFRKRNGLKPWAAAQIDGSPVFARPNAQA